MIWFPRNPAARREPWWRGWATPRGLALRAALAVAAFGAVHALGWREDMSFLSLTASPGHDLAGTTFRGVAYLGLHFGATLLAPALALASLLLRAWNRVSPPAAPRAKVGP